MQKIEEEDRVIRQKDREKIKKAIREWMQTTDRIKKALQEHEDRAIAILDKYGLIHPEWGEEN